MSACLFTIFGSQGRVVSQKEISLPATLTTSDFASLTQTVLAADGFRFATLREGGVTRGLFLARDLIPQRAVQVTSSRPRGFWVTGAATLGTWGGGRVFIGPKIFFRQVDLVAREAWMAPLLVGFAPDPRAARVPEAEDEIYQVFLGELRCLYAPVGTRWEFYSAGNTPEERVAQTLAATRPLNASSWVWGLGAISLTQAAG